VAVSSLGVRLDLLRRAQNADGGWSYFPGKQSWLEPTFYAALALHGDPAADRAWALLRSWQRADGSWHPAAEVQDASCFGTALCVTLAQVHGEADTAANSPFQKGVANLLATAGTESRPLSRALSGTLSGLRLHEDEWDFSLKGWPWKPGNSSWVEPTVHAVVALKKARLTKAGGSNPELRERVRMGEAHLINVRCSDAGWNYGNNVILGGQLPGYPETTGLALVALQGHADVGKSLDVAAQWLQDTNSPLAKAWLTIALRLHGTAVPEGRDTMPSADRMILALEALAAPDGNYGLLNTEAAA
jgi:hypothetical protein